MSGRIRDSTPVPKSPPARKPAETVDSFTRRFMVVVLVPLVFAVAGCEPAPIYDRAQGRLPVGYVPDRAKWVVYGTVANPGYAVDGSIQTVATAPDGARNASLTINLGKTSHFHMIVVDHGRSEFGFARHVLVETSSDGKHFTPRHRAFGTRRVSTFLLPRPVVAKYLRLRATVPGEKPWSLAEIHIQ